MMSEEKDNDFDTDSDEGDKGRKKKWGRNKDKGSTDAPVAGDEDVRLFQNFLGSQQILFPRFSEAGMRPGDAIPHVWLQYQVDHIGQDKR